MRWPFRRIVSGAMRRSRLGFTLMETLVALSVMAILVSGILASVSWALGGLAERTERAWLVEFARSIADEYRITRNPSLLGGESSSGYSWKIDIGEPETLSIPDDRLVEATLTTWRSNRPDRTETLSFLLAPSQP